MTKTENQILPGQCAVSVPIFCARNGISPAFFYKLKRQGLTPREMAVGARRLISPEAEAIWRREREAAAQAEREPVTAG